MGRFLPGRVAWKSNQHYTKRIIASFFDGMIQIIVLCRRNPLPMISTSWSRPAALAPLAFGLRRSRARSGTSGSQRKTGSGSSFETVGLSTYDTIERRCLRSGAARSHHLTWTPTAFAQGSNLDTSPSFEHPLAFGRSNLSRRMMSRIRIRTSWPKRYARRGYYRRETNDDQ